MGWLFGFPKSPVLDALDRQLKDLSRRFPLWVDDDCKFVIVGSVHLPAGYNCSETELLIEVPADFPVSPPGLGGNLVYVSPRLRFRGRRLRDIHQYVIPAFRTPNFGPWAWWCYETIRWDPLQDNLIKFVEMVRADLTNPPTR